MTAATLLCPVCGYANRPAAQVCEDCGLTIPQYQACLTCGFMNTADSRFCGSCGSPVGAERKGSGGPSKPTAPVAGSAANPAAGSAADPASGSSPVASTAADPAGGSPADPAAGPDSPIHKALAAFKANLDADMRAKQPPEPPGAGTGAGPTPDARVAPRSWRLPSPQPPPGGSVPRSPRAPSGEAPAFATDPWPARPAPLPAPVPAADPSRSTASSPVDPLVGPILAKPADAPAVTGPTFHLIHEGTGVEITLPLADGALTIGRPGGDPDLDISGFPEATVVSRKHARLIVTAGQLGIEDLGSANGTYVNNVRVRGAAVPLSDGDRVAFGQGAKVVFKVRLAP